MSLTPDGPETRRKVRSLVDLSTIASEARQKGQRIVHCHGVFDLLHVGHIRHFSQARKFGDLLIVTVTADRHVNKGPHRPAFPDQLRAEVVASLECVDYVAINDAPLATEAIRALRPHVYVKGSEYRDTKDITAGIIFEEQAVKECGGQVAFTDDIVFSSSTLINRHIQLFPLEVKNYLTGFASRHSAAEVIGALDRLRGLKVLVLGDTIIDEYQYCQAIGKSSKDPTLAVKHISTEQFAGGVLAIANHLAGFSDHVGLLTFVGERNPREDFVRGRLKSNVAATLLRKANAPTIVKRRFIESYHFTKLLEVYEIDDARLDPSTEELFCAELVRLVPQYDAVIVADFGHGMMTRRAIEVVSAHARFMAVNVQSNAANLGYHAISKYSRADYLCLTEAELRLEARDRECGLKETMLEIARRLGSRNLSVTRGKEGSVCWGREDGFCEAPALAGQVVDRVGAGDAFLAITSPCAALGLPADLIAFVGNAVGAQAVAIVGNRDSIERVALYKQIESLLK